MSFFYAPNPPNLSKKACPPPQDITAISMNYQII